MTVDTWIAQTLVEDLRTGPKDAGSTALSIEEEAIFIAFWREAARASDDSL